MFIIYRKGIDLHSSNKIDLTKEEYQHVKSLRLKEGDEIFVSNGLGIAYKAILKNQICEIKKEDYIKNNFLNVSIYSALPSGNRLDKMIEMAVALGMSDFCPIIFDFSERKDYNLQRVNKIGIQSCYQSRRLILPNFFSPISFSDFLHHYELHPQKKFFYLEPYQKGINVYELQNLVKNFELKNIGIIVGPEGGFSSFEKEILKKHFSSINLSQNILRIEVAVISILSIFSYFSNNKI